MLKLNLGKESKLLQKKLLYHYEKVYQKVDAKYLNQISTYYASY